VPADLPEAMGGPAERLLADERRLRLQARVSSRAQVAPGDRLDLAVHASRAHVFDPRTGDSLTAILDRP